MITAIVVFDVQESDLETAKTATATFVRNIPPNEPHTLTYRSYQEKNNQGHFFHSMEFADDNARQSRRRSSYMQEFTSILYPCCIATPKPFYLTVLAKVTMENPGQFTPHGRQA